MWQLIELSFPVFLKLIVLVSILLVGLIAKSQSTTSGDTRTGWGVIISPTNTAIIDTGVVMSVSRASDSITSLKASVATKLTTSAFTAAAMISLFGFTPYSNANPNSYISAVPAQTFASLTSKPTTLSGYGITDAYPLSGNPSAFLTSITSGNVTTALGFTPYNATNPNSYITASSLSPYKLISDSGRQISNYATGYDLNKVRDSLVALIPTSTVATSRTISTTSPLTGGGDLSANRTFAINNAAADNSTKGAATFDSSYFDASSGLINFAVTSGTGTVSSSNVTINQPKGKITFNSPNIIAAGTTGVTFTNSFITSTSIINIGLNGNGSNLTGVNAYIKSQTAGSCVINVQNLSLLSLFNTSLIIDFFIVN